MWTFLSSMKFTELRHSVLRLVFIISLFQVRFYRKWMYQSSSIRIKADGGNSTDDLLLTQQTQRMSVPWWRTVVAVMRVNNLCGVMVVTLGNVVVLPGVIEQQPRVVLSSHRSIRCLRSSWHPQSGTNVTDEILHQVNVINAIVNTVHCVFPLPFIHDTLEFTPHQLQDRGDFMLHFSSV